MPARRSGGACAQPARMPVTHPSDASKLAAATPSPGCREGACNVSGMPETQSQTAPRCDQQQPEQATYRGVPSFISQQILRHGCAGAPPSDPRTSPEALERLAADGVDKIRAAALANPVCPSQVLLAASRWMLTERCRRAVATNPNCRRPRSSICSPAGRAPLWTRVAAARNRSCPPRCLTFSASTVTDSALRCGLQPELLAADVGGSRRRRLQRDALQRRLQSVDAG